MLEFRRILEFSSRVHTYLLAVYFFFALLFVLFLYYPINETLVYYITVIQMVLGWTLFLDGVWILFASIVSSIAARVVVLKPIILTIIRILIYFGVSVLLDLLNTLITSGLSYGG